MKVWKRCLAAILAFMIFMTSVNISEAAGNYDTENYIWTSGDAEVVAEYYGLDDKETSALFSGAVNKGNEYTLSAPYDNGTEGKRDLLAVDYTEKYLYAKALPTDNFTWLPTEAELTAEGEVKETITLTAAQTFYHDEEYYASGAFTYDGNSYTVNVIYQLTLDISAEEQTRLLQIPQILAQTAVNLEGNLKGANSDLKALGEMIPYLSQLLTYRMPAEEELVNEETGEVEIIQTSEPALDPAEDADVIGAIEALSEEHTASNGLLLYHVSEEYRSSNGKNVLAFTFEKGAYVLELSEALYGHVEVLKDSTRLRNVCSNLNTVEPELYEQLKNLQKVLRNLLGTLARPGELASLQDRENWTILDKSVQSRILKEGYTDEDFAALESAVYGLRNSEPEMPVIETETFTAAKIGVSCDITFHCIDVTVNAETTSGQPEDEKTYPLEAVTTTLKLPESSSAEAIRTAVFESGIERTAIDSWNGQNSEYEINTNYYDREESSLPKELRENIEYEISYTPKKYKLKPNFGYTMEVPYGYVFELPVSEDEDVSYDYVVEPENGSAVSYSEGTKLKVEQSMTITQTKGTEKAEYRLYDFLINDLRYNMSDEVKQVLASTALESPTLKIRMPDSSKVGEVLYEDGTYYIEAGKSAAGILGMSWEPDVAAVMEGDTVLLEVPFEDGIARWTIEGFTHVNVSYRLKIEKVESDLIGDRPLDETEDVLYALNLPHELVTHTVRQNRLLNGTEGVTAKVLYQELSAVADMMTPANLTLLSSLMETTEQINAMKRLQKSEYSGGAWNTATDELALYTYLKACDSANWSLATYYKQGLYENIAKQSGVLAECLEVIVSSEKLWDSMQNLGLYSYIEKLERIVELLPKMKELSQSIEGPHEAIDMEDEGYEELINLLISMEGETSPVDTSDGIYAYSSIRRNQGNVGTLTILVKVGSKMEQKSVFTYTLEEENGHILTEEEAEVILQMVDELEAAAGMTEEERPYYTAPSVAIPKAGETIKKNAELNLIYSPMEYHVTIAGVPEYEASFRYKGDYIISLPPYSDEADANCKYVYWIDSKTSVEVENGTTGFYEFTKEDLTARFDVNGHFELYKREEVVLNAAIRAVIEPDGELIRAFEEEIIDKSNTYLCLDADPNGIRVSEFLDSVNFVSEEAEEVILGEVTQNGVGTISGDRLLVNGSTIDCFITDRKGKEHCTTFTIIILGDVNKSGKVDNSDTWLMAASYTGNVATPISERDGAAKRAADVNGNGSMDSNDAWLMWRKTTDFESNSFEEQ